MKNYWLNDWSNGSASLLETIFGIERGSLDDVDILLASYVASDDSGYAFILYQENQQLYEINASHDSEIDFLGQWIPEQTSVEVLLFRLNRGNLGSAEASDNLFADELRLLLKQYVQ